MSTQFSSCTAFDGHKKVATGSAAQVGLAVKALLSQRPQSAVLIFDDTTGRQVDFDLRGTDADVASRLAEQQRDEAALARGPGRPKLGVIAREITLLPRHWEWLSAQPGGASVALRKLVEAARASKSGNDGIRQAQAAADRFMLALAGNLPGYEDAARALYAGNAEQFAELTAAWPPDVGAHSRKLATNAFAA